MADELTQLDLPHKRKLDDSSPPDLTTTQIHLDNQNGDDDDDVEHVKRPRFHHLSHQLGSTNGLKSEGDEEHAVSNAETAEAVENVEAPADDEQECGNEQLDEAVPEEVNEVEPGSESELKADIQSDDAKLKDVEVPLSENDQLENNVKGSSEEELQEPATEMVEQGDGASDEHHSGNGTRTRKIEIPNNKVGVLIGKSGETIKLLQHNSGAKIQITRDADSDPRASTRPVELVGTLESINKAERLIKDVIAEADAGGSPSLVARGFNATTTGSVEIEMHVASDKVGLIIGRGGETIRSLQTRSGARIQLIPQSSTGDQSKEKKVKVTGDKKQVEIARDLIKEVMNQPVGRPSQFSNNNNQQGYRPRGQSGPGGATQWGPRGPPQSMPYDYQQRGAYPSQNHQQPYSGQSYGNYPQQGPPRGNYGSGWEHRPPAHGPPSHTGGYDYYGQGGGHAANAPVSASQAAHMPGHASGQSMGPPHSQANYNYGQPRASDYQQPAPYSHQMAPPPAQSYGAGYGDPKYDGQGQMQQQQPQQPYGGPGYGHQQPYSRAPAPHGMPSQGYGHPTAASQPVDNTGYQAPQQYAQNVQPQVQQQPQQYQYASGAPYGSAPAGPNDGYAQPQPGYPQQGGQPVASYGHQTASGYPQAAPPTAGYGQYPSAPQAGYSDPSATGAGSANYGYQGQVDPSAYGAGQVYNAVPPVAQQGYAQPQPAPAQPGYDQSAAAVAQSGGYASAPAGAPPAAVAYGKTVSPQPGYPQYDASQQMYAAPR